MSRGYNRAYSARRNSAPQGIAWSVSILVALIIGALVFGCAPRTGAANAAPASYPLCASDPDYSNAPCVVLSLVDGTDGYELIQRISDGSLASVPFMACASEDGPAPCVWDTRRGNGSAGPGVAQFVVIRT
jgi:hypothetical protein